MILYSDCTSEKLFRFLRNGLVPQTGLTAQAVPVATLSGFMPYWYSRNFQIIAEKKMKSMKDMTTEEKRAFLKELAVASLEKEREERRKKEAIR